MKTNPLPLAVIASGFLALGVMPTLLAAEESGTADNKIHDFVTHHWQEMLQVTKTPYHVQAWGMEPCAPPFPFEQPHDPHGEHWIHVLVSPGGTNTMLTGKGAYPEGTIILKQKLLDAGGTKIDFYTGMRKRERNYNRDLNDWEFFTLDHRYKVTARGKIESCMDCHRKYKSTDYVSRRYLTDQEATRAPRPATPTNARPQK